MGPNAKWKYGTLLFISDQDVEYSNKKSIKPCEKHSKVWLHRSHAHVDGLGELHSLWE